MRVERYRREKHAPFLESWTAHFDAVFDPDLLPAEGYVASDETGPIAVVFVYRDPSASVAFIDNMQMAPGANGFLLFAAMRVLYKQLAESCKDTKRVIIDTASPFVIATLQRTGFQCAPVLNYRATARFF